MGIQHGEAKPCEVPLPEDDFKGMEAQGKWSIVR